MNSNFVPKRRLIENVTNALAAVVTTIEDHGFETGYVVRVIVPQSYGMSLYAQAKIVVLTTDSFITDINTINQSPFVEPTFVPDGTGFTQAQVVPISGVTDNIA